MQKIEKREVAVSYCDQCGEEKSHLEKCCVCKKEMCMKDGGRAHFAYSIELYRYGDAQRLISHVCTACGDSESGVTLTIRELLDGMIGETPIGPVMIR